MKKKYELEDVTPQEMRCGAFGGCPSIYKAKDVTPKDMKCVFDVCPSIHETSDSYLIVGKKISPADVGLEEKVGKGEVLIEVPRKLIDDKGA